jgi:MFS-type transporter involved in bile tolerance (Atg22 family)
MTSGRALGLMLISLVFGQLAADRGGAGLFVVVAAVVLLPLPLLPVLARDGARRAREAFDWRAFSAFADRGLLGFLVFAFVLSAALTAQLGLGTYFLRVRLEATSAQIGTFGTLTSVGLVAGSAGFSLLRRRLGFAWVLRGSVAAMSLYAFAMRSMSDTAALHVSALANGTIWGLLLTAALAMSMRRTQPRIAGTMFAAIMACFNLGGVFGESVLTGLVDDLGFSGVFLALSLAALLILPVSELVLGEEEGARTARALPRTSPSP